MKVANLIDITPEEIAELEKMGYAGMNVNLATGRIDLVKAEEESCCCDCDCNCCDCDEEKEEYTMEDVIAEGLRAIGIIR